mgnify:FL=1|tara:strand:- start:334 stop:564 length:231 start_codon:yes stop_codon:yes gene_type:complete
MKGIEFDGRVWDDRHGGPFDRGASDSYYRRGIDPHFYIGSTYQSPRVEEDGMTDEELEAYQAGYRYNEAEGHYKEW